MKKSLFLCLLLLAIALTSCGNNNTPVKTNAIKYDYDVFPGTDWGMTKQEVLDIYNLSQKDIEEDLVNDNGFAKGETYKISFQNKVYDLPAKLTFIFCKKQGDCKKDVGLIMVMVHFLDTKDIKVRNDIRLRYEEDFENAKKGRIEDEDSHYPDNVIADLKDKQLQQKVLDVLAHMYKKELQQDVKTLQEDWIDSVQLSTLHLNLDTPYLGEQTHIRYEGLVSAIINSLE